MQNQNVLFIILLAISQASFKGKYNESIRNHINFVFNFLCEILCILSWTLMIKHCKTLLKLSMDCKRQRKSKCPENALFK